jgi:hypothetical protein
MIALILAMASKTWVESIHFVGTQKKVWHDRVVYTNER